MFCFRSDMSDEQTSPGYVPIVGKIVGDGEVKPYSGGGNRVFTREENEALWGSHPYASWGEEIRARIAARRRGKYWMREG